MNFTTLSNEFPKIKKETHLNYFFLPLFYQTSLVTFNFYTTLQFTHTHKKKNNKQDQVKKGANMAAPANPPHFTLTNFIWLHNTENNIILNFSSTLHTQICHLFWLNNNHEKKQQMRSSDQRSQYGGRCSTCAQLLHKPLEFFIVD